MSHSRTHFTPIATLAALALSASVAHAAISYTAVDLQLFTTGYAETIGTGVSNGIAVGTGINGTDQTALRWDLTTDTASALPIPSGYTQSLANGISGSTIAGAIGTDTSVHAVTWTGPTHTVNDLNPTPTSFSIANATNGTSTVGVADNNAALWTGPTNTYTNLGNVLDPTTFQSSQATAISPDGHQQVGVATDMSNSNHAILWQDSGTSPIDLNAGHTTGPTGFTNSSATGVDNHNEVGFATQNGDGLIHAYLWNDTLNTVTALAASGFENTQANAISGTEIVGYGTQITGDQHFNALLWNNLGTSFTNLQDYIDAQLAGTYTDSFAYGIDSNGWIVGDANFDIGGGNFVRHAIVWIPTDSVPEPASLSLLGLGVTALLSKRTKRLSPRK